MGKLMDDKNSWHTYKTPYEEDGTWYVEVTDSRTDETSVEAFNSQDEADTFIRDTILKVASDKNASSEPSFNMSTSKWELYIFPPNVSDFYELFEFSTEEEAIRHFEQCDTLNADQKAHIKDNVAGQEGFAEKMAKYGKNEEDIDAVVAKMNGDEEDAEAKILYAKKLKQTKLEFRRKKATYENKARNVLLECAKFYLGEDADNNYVKYKSDISKMGLASLMFQMDTAEEVIYSMAAEIKLGNVWARNVEVMAQLQRVVLDIGKFQHEYISGIEKSMRELKEDLIASGKAVDGEEEDVKYFKGGNKALLKELGEFTSEIETYKLEEAKPSKNIRLREGIAAEEVEFDEINDNSGMSDIDEDMGEISGLESYGSESDK